MSDSGDEWFASLVFGSVHAVQHLFMGLLPPLIPVLTVELSLPLWKLGLLMSAYSLVSGLGQTPMGVLADRFDRRYLLPPGLAVLALAYVTFAAGPTLGAGLGGVEVGGVSLSGPFLLLLGSMALAGAGASVVHPTGYPLISANVSRGRKGRALGLWGSGSKLGDMAAPVGVAALLIVLTWERLLFVLGAFGVAYAAALWVVLGRDGIDTLAPQSGTEAGSSGEGEASSETSPGAGDRRTFVYPMVVILALFVSRGIATKGIRTFVPTFVTDVYGYSLSAFGLTLGPQSLANAYFSALLLTAAVVQLVTGSLADRYDHRTVMVGSFGVATVGLVALSYVRLSPVVLLVVLLLVGGGIWGANPARDALVSDISPPEGEGRTFGSLFTFTQVVSAATPVVIGYLADVSGIRDGFRYLALATLLSVLCAALLLSPRVYVDREADADATATSD
ncbi:MAG: MFS transporter [Salinigranum sp.]